jgi:hypothetical protein
MLYMAQSVFFLYIKNVITLVFSFIMPCIYFSYYDFVWEKKKKK